MITIVKPGTVKLDYGPMQMTIFASKAGCLLTDAAKESAVYAMQVLADLAAVKSFAAQAQTKFNEQCHLTDFPEVLQRMVQSVQLSGDVTLTPMAAVAGTIADMAAEWLTAQGATKVIVNNGGDIAIRLLAGEHTTVGIAPAIGLSPSHVIHIEATSVRPIGGIATSGLGGRSFTKGIATAAVVAAGSASFADACATSVGNATYVEHPNIICALAQELDPNTDIWGHTVVREVGVLPEAVLQQALYNGWQRANELYQSGLINGAAIFVQNIGIMIPENFAALH